MAIKPIVITITGPESAERGLLAQFIAEKLHYFIGADADITINGTRSTKDEKDLQPSEKHIIEYLGDQPIKILMPHGPRVIDYKLDGTGNLRSALMQFVGIGDQSFRGCSRALANLLTHCLVNHQQQGPVQVVEVSAPGCDSIVVTGLVDPGRKMSVDEMQAHMESLVKAVLLDAE